jgi:antitoxin MazE
MSWVTGWALTSSVFLVNTKVMKTKVRNWGNSLAIRIPRTFARETRICNGTEVDLKLQSGRLVISRPNRKRHTLRSLLAKVRPGNLTAESDWGAARGGEVW